MKRTRLMIRLGMLALVCWMLTGFACAEEGLPAQVTALFQEACPSHSVACFDQCGQIAAAVMTDGSAQVLCMAEQKGSAWELVVANPAALRQDAAVASLLLDTDETLYWSYTDEAETDTYHAVRSGGQWRVCSLMNSEIHQNGSSESHVGYTQGRLQYTTYLCDENDNVLSSRSYAPVPAAWLEELLPLDVYDDSRFPKPFINYTHSWLSGEATALAAAELFPGSAFLGGCAKEEHVEFFLQRPDGERVIAACRYDEDGGWKITLSTPLPEGVEYGRENFSSSLVIGDLLVDIGPVDANTFGVTLICNAADGQWSMFSLGKNWVTGEVPNGYENCFGDHPWSDITLVDWNRLPRSLEEALAGMDTAGWAVVNNPDPADRLHLRVKPQRGAQSLGKYYNGTPVRVLETKGDWVHVDVFGVRGWMMKAYLAFGAAGHAVEAVFPARMPVESQRDHWVFAEPDSAQAVANYQGSEQHLLVLAIVGDEWYHVWFPQDNLSGYVLQSDWWEGNG